MKFQMISSGKPPRFPRQIFLLNFLAVIFCGAGISSANSPARNQKPTTAPHPAVKPASAPLASISDQAWKLLITGAESKNFRKRTDAIAALATIEGQPAAVKLIEAGLTDKSVDVRRIAAAALGNMGAKAAIPELRTAMDDKDATVSFAAAEALWRLGDQSGRDIFYAVVLGNRQASRGFISSNIHGAIRTLHDPRALAMIGVNEGSSALLGPFSEGVTIAEALARDSSAPARAFSVALLGEYPSPDSEKILEDVLDDKNVAVRAAAANALGGFRDPALIPGLAPLMSEKGTPLIKPDASVRYMAAAAIIRLLHMQKPLPFTAIHPLKSGGSLIPH